MVANAISCGYVESFATWLSRNVTTQPMETDDDEIKPKHGAKTGKKSE